MDRDAFTQLLYRSPEAVARALVILHERQTPDERASGDTRHRNAQGFNATDAGFGSSLARQVAGGRTLTRHQLVAARQMLGKYAGQLLASGVAWEHFDAQHNAGSERQALEALAAELLGLD